MRFRFKGKAEKDLKKLPNKGQKKLKLVMEGIINAERIEDLKNCKKLRGDKTAYSIRFGKYRIGFKYKGDRINIYRVLHRKDIYSKFP